MFFEYTARIFTLYVKKEVKKIMFKIIGHWIIAYKYYRKSKSSETFLKRSISS